jgi:hypothetical protein
VRASRRRGRGRSSSGIAARVPLLLLLLCPSCAPIDCPARHSASKELFCPACDALHPCPCTTAWTCKPDPDLTAERRRERSARQAREEAASRAADQRRVLQEEGAQRQRAVVRIEEERRRAEDARRAIEERRRRDSETTNAAPVGPVAACTEPCPGNGRRHVRINCENEGRILVGQSLICPAALPEGVRGCPVPWFVETFCEVPAPPARGTCGAAEGQCCLPDGTVVRPCGPVADRTCRTNTNWCGSGGFCHPCR